MFFVLTLSLFEKALNTALSADAVTQTTLANTLHQKNIRVQLNSPAICVDMLVDNQKIRLAPTPANTENMKKPDCTIACANLVELLSVITTDGGGNLPVSGNSKVLMQLRHVLANMQLNIGLLLQPFLGASIAGQINSAINTLQTQTKKTAAQAQFYSQEWLKEDNDLLAKRWQMQQFKDDIRHLRTESERLEAKLAAKITANQAAKKTTKQTQLEPKQTSQSMPQKNTPN